MYTKQTQTAKEKVTRKLCKTCGKTRDIKFFTSKRAIICNDCKVRKWREQRKNSQGKVNKKADKQWAEDVKALANFRCEFCGSTEHLNSHHIFSRSNKSVRHELENGVCLCSLHHVFSTTFSAHKASAEFISWIIEKRGQEWFERLRKKANKVKEK